MMTSEDFEEYNKRFGEQILQTFSRLNQTKIVSIYDVEETKSGRLFTAEFSNGEVLRLFTHDKVEEGEEDTAVGVGDVMFNHSEDMIVLDLQGSPWYVFVEYYKAAE